MTSQQAIQKFFDAIKVDISADQVAKGIKASGKSAESLKSEVSYEGGMLTGSAYFQQQITGRKPGTMPPVSDILAWIKVKNIQSDIKPEQLAWAIAKKIAKGGTDIHQGKRPGLDFLGIVGKNKDELIKNLVKGTKEQILTQIRGAIKT